MCSETHSGYNDVLESRPSLLVILCLLHVSSSRSDPLAPGFRIMFGGLDYSEALLCITVAPDRNISTITETPAFLLPNVGAHILGSGRPLMLLAAIR